VGLTQEEQAILATDCSLFEEIWECFDAVTDRHVLPSMRSLQFGGRPIEVYDIVMYIAPAVLAGGIRRSATLCLFSLDDKEMANAKTGDWLERNPQRAYSNNSALLVSNETERKTFEDLFQRIRESGEPGFYFDEDVEFGANPCVEIGLCPQAVVNADEVERAPQRGPPASSLRARRRCCSGPTPNIQGRFALHDLNHFNHE